jgi:hypothetical protein
MKLLLISGTLCAIATAASAETTSLVCTGVETVSDYTPNEKTKWVSRSMDVSFEVAIDPEAKTVKMNGKPMVLMSISDAEVVFSTRKPSLVSRVLDAPVVTLSRQTGVWRTGDGTGRCIKADSAKLF